MSNEPLASDNVLPFRETNPYEPSGLRLLDDIPEKPQMATWKTGFEEWNHKVHLAPGTLSVVTGLPGSGKTYLWAQIWSYVVAKYETRALIASFECPPKPQYRRYLREFYHRKREREMTDAQIASADDFIRDHYCFLEHPDETPTLEWFLDMAEMAVARWGVKVIQLDPWNRLESQRGPKETEPEYVSRCLRECTVFAKQMGVHQQIAAHPAKREGKRRELAPDLEDVSGAMHWWNMVDQGFVVHRQKLWTPQGGRCFDATFYHRKARFEELGYPCALDIRFNPITRVFESVTTERDGAPADE